jgi:hypothetical protein
VYGCDLFFFALHLASEAWRWRSVRAYSVLGSTQGRRAILFSWKSRHAPVANRCRMRCLWYAMASLSCHPCSFAISLAVEAGGAVGGSSEPVLCALLLGMPGHLACRLPCERGPGPAGHPAQCELLHDSASPFQRENFSDVFGQTQRKPCYTLTLCFINGAGGVRVRRTRSSLRAIFAPLRSATGRSFLTAASSASAGMTHSQ